MLESDDEDNHQHHQYDTVSVSQSFNSIFNGSFRNGALNLMHLYRAIGTNSTKQDVCQRTIHGHTLHFVQTAELVIYVCTYHDI